jgi:hypothetical protein
MNGEAVGLRATIAARNGGGVIRRRSAVRCEGGPPDAAELPSAPELGPSVPALDSRLTGTTAPLSTKSMPPVYRDVARWYDLPQVIFPVLVVQ